METHYPIEHVENTNVTIRHNKKQKTNNRTNQESDQETNVPFEDQDDFLHDDVETQYPTEHEEVTNVTVRDKKNQKTKKQTKTKNKKENIDINSLDNMSKANTIYILNNVFLSYSNLTAIMEVTFKKETVQELCTFVRECFEKG